MKKLLLTLTAVAIVLRGSLAIAAESAPVTLTIQNYRALTNALATLADAAVPGSAGDVLDDLQAGLGVDALRTVDIERPWQIALWLEGIGGQPSTSLWIPTKDFDALKIALVEGPLLAELGENPVIAENKGYAAVYLPGTASSAGARTAHDAWTPERAAQPGAVVALDIRPGDALRQQLLQGLGMIRLTVGGAVSAQSKEALQGMDPMALSQLFGVYLDFIEVGLKGWENFGLSLDMAGDNLKIREAVTALSGSELASWFQGGQGDLGGVAGYANTEAPAVFAMRWKEAPTYMPLLKKLMGFSLQMQGVEAGSEVIAETERLIELMAPLEAAGTADFESGLGFGVVYKFPGRDVQELYRLMTSYLQNSMQSQVGENKFYQSITFEENQREVAGVKVARLTMQLNLDAPMYQGPGQKETFENMWPGGKMEFDYAVKGDSLVVASPARLEALLRTDPATAKSGLGSLGPSTVLAARFNLLKFIPQFFKANPMVPEETRQQLEKIDSRGTDILFRLDLDGSLSSETLVPLQLIRSVSQSL